MFKQSKNVSKAYTKCTVSHTSAEEGLCIQSHLEPAKEIVMMKNLVSQYNFLLGLPSPLASLNIHSNGYAHIIVLELMIAGNSK